jgi:manganese transport protein
MFQRARPRSMILVPALLTTIAYVDPGNFGTNIAGGATQGFTLVWVVVGASFAAALVQYLAGKLGLATSRGLAQHWAERLGTGPRIASWLQAELVVVMTDLAEVVGGALGLQLLFGIPLAIGAMLIGAVSFALLGLRVWAGEVFRPVALALLAIVAVTVLWAVGTLSPDLGGAAAGIEPRPLNDDALLMAVGIVGATVMPHALYFHSAMSRRTFAQALLKPDASGPPLRPFGQSKTVCRQLFGCIAVAMSVAAVVNVAILVLGASIAVPGVDSIQTASAGLIESHRSFAANLLGIALVASGLASSVIGAWTGQAVMAGFLRRSIRVWKRRLVALAPPVVALALGVDPDWALVASQIVLSFALPVTLSVLVLLTSSRSVMGSYRNSRPVTVAAWSVTAVITSMDLAVIFGG